MKEKNVVIPYIIFQVYLTCTLPNFTYVLRRNFCVTVSEQGMHARGAIYPRIFMYTCTYLHFYDERGKYFR